MKKKFYIISTIIFLIDQISKLLLIVFLKEPFSVIPKFFSITLTKNTGGAFSFLKGNVALLSMIGIILFIGILMYIKNNPPKKRIELLALSSILGGLMGNLVDRIFRGGVIDFLDFTIFNYNYPIFNIADIAIVLGIFTIILLEMREKHHESR